CPKAFNRACVLSSRNFKTRRGAASPAGAGMGSGRSFWQAPASSTISNGRKKRSRGAWGFIILPKERHAPVMAPRAAPGERVFGMHAYRIPTFGAYHHHEARRDHRPPDPLGV